MQLTEWGLGALIVILAGLLFTATHSIPRARGSDAQGKYVVGGGVGGEPCPSFLSVMTEARQMGGVFPAAPTHPFLSYILGFQTGFNKAAPGVLDVFADLKSDHPGFEALNWVENWCQTHPTERFGSGVAALGATLDPR